MLSTLGLVRSADVPHLHQQAYEIFCAHRDKPWQFSTFKEALMLPHSVIVQFNGNCLAYAAVSEVLGEFEIQDISVAFDHTKQGIGSTLLSRIIDQAREASGECILLEVAKLNLNAQSLYKKHGFSVNSIRKKYYCLPNNQYDDALLMRKAL